VTPELVEAFEAYAYWRGREAFVPNILNQEDWDDLCRDKSLREGLLVGLMSECSVGVASVLKSLREKFGAQVSRYPQLSLALAFVRGRRAGDRSYGEMRDRRRSRPVPPLEECFEYYVANASRMKVSLSETPWPILAYVVDNDVPIPERRWALDRYGRLRLDDFGDIYYDVHYDRASLRGKAQLEGRPHSLPNILKYGGVCSDRAYYASRVMKSLGLPAVYCAGQGKRGGHAWTLGLKPQATAFMLDSTGRFDFDHYYNGEVFFPVRDRIIEEYELHLLAKAVSASYRGYLDARIACHVYDLANAEQRVKMTGLLRGATRRNPFCPGPWRRLGEACVAGLLPPEEGGRLCIHIFTSMNTVPDMTYEVLEKVMTARFKKAEARTASMVERNLAILKRAADVYTAAKRPDLCVKVQCLHGTYLEALGRREEACSLYLATAEQYADKHFGFVEPLRRALALRPDPQDAAWRVTLLKRMLAVVPQYSSGFTRSFESPSLAWREVHGLLQKENLRRRRGR